MLMLGMVEGDDLEDQRRRSIDDISKSRGEDLKVAASLTADKTE